ncbi:MAG: hypothetical protein SF187_03485 [Deltaproteobacteria bacterium]|nr:hypothetical protein [Deltaproteobacteria bacterium]
MKPDPSKDMSELKQLADVTVPPQLVAKVMQAVSQPQPFRLWRWLRTPHRFELRLSPLWLVSTLSAVTVFAAAATSLWRPPTPPSFVATQNAQGEVLVRFVIRAAGAQQVAVAGDFNDWNPDGATLVRLAQPDVFAITLPLAKGKTYSYKFLVDGEWIEDPAAEARPDGFGNRNSVLRL